MSDERDRRAAEVRREAEARRAAPSTPGTDGLAGEGTPYGTGRVGTQAPVATEDATRRAARAGAREAIEEKEQEKSGSGGL